MNSLIIFTIAISLSMDAFSLSLAYGTLNLNKKNIYELSIIIGIYHFIMPLFGVICGSKILHFVPINDDFLVFLVLIIIGIEMLIESFKDRQQLKIMKITELLFFGLAVSIDSFSVGIGLKSISTNIWIASMIISLTSLIFTYVGLLIGKKINCLIGRFSTILGGIILMIIGLLYLI